MPDIHIAPASDSSQPTSGSKGIPTIIVREPTVGPSYPVEIVRRVLHTNRQRLGDCQAKSKGQPPGPPAVLRFTIAEDGKVSEAAFITNGKAIEPDPARRCTLDVIRGLAFPEPNGKLIITYPINVDPVH